VRADAIGKNRLCEPGRLKRELKLRRGDDHAAVTAITAVLN
jgi:hypothetical protein